MKDEKVKEKRHDFLLELEALASDFWGREFAFLVAAVTKIACAVCDGKASQYVIKKLLRLNGSNKVNAYRIIFGMPQDSSRHGLNEVGMIFQPKEKKALSEAIRLRDVIVVNDAVQNPLTEYMATHARKKKINHLAVLPIPLVSLPGIAPEWLVIIDRVECETRFSEEEIEFLRKGAGAISASLLSMRNEKKEELVGMSAGKKKLVSSMEDLLRDPMTILGLAHERLQRSVENGKADEAVAYSKMAMRNSLQIANQMVLLGEYAEFLKGDMSEIGTTSLSEYVSIFKQDEFEIVEVIEDSERGTKLNVPGKLTRSLFGKIREYMLANKNGFTPKLAISDDEEGVNIFFYSSGFQPYKVGLDLNLNCILDLAEVLGGRAEADIGVLKLFLPRGN